MDPFIGEIKIVSFNFAPRDWAACDGQSMQISQNSALFSLLGTMYGGDGRTTFNLPDFRGKVPIHFNASYPQGSSGGAATHTLTSAEMPAHTHAANASSAVSNTKSPTGNTWAAMVNGYSAASNTSMNSAALSAVGANQAHENRQPYLVVNFIIAIQGIFPSRS